MKHCLVTASLLMASASALAAPNATTQREITGLLQALEHSGCRFQRNGSWHEAAEARSHLQRKYDYLLKRNLAGCSHYHFQSIQYYLYISRRCPIASTSTTIRSSSIRQIIR